MPIITKPPLFLSRSRVYRGGTTQVIENDVWTKVQWNTVNYDAQGEWDITTNYRWTAKQEGYYLVVAQVIWQTSVVGSLHSLIIRKNVAEVTRNHQFSETVYGFSHTVRDILLVAADDFVDVQCYQKTGGTVKIEADSRFTYMAIHKLS